MVISLGEVGVCVGGGGEGDWVVQVGEEEYGFYERGPCRP